MYRVPRTSGLSSHMNFWRIYEFGYSRIHNKIYDLSNPHSPKKTNQQLYYNLDLLIVSLFEFNIKQNKKKKKEKPLMKEKRHKLNLLLLNSTFFQFSTISFYSSFFSIPRAKYNVYAFSPLHTSVHSKTFSKEKKTTPCSVVVCASNKFLNKAQNEIGCRMAWQWHCRGEKYNP